VLFYAQITPYYLCVEWVLGFAPTWLRQVSPAASRDHFNHCLYPYRYSHSLSQSNRIWHYKQTQF